MAKLNVNGKVGDFEAEADTPLLWVIREQLGLIPFPNHLCTLSASLAVCLYCRRFAFAFTKDPRKSSWMLPSVPRSARSARRDNAAGRVGRGAIGCIALSPKR